MSDRLADLFPQPVMLTLGGGRWLVSQYRLRDLAFLENWLQSRRPDPLENPALSSDDQAERWDALRAAYDAEEVPPPALGSEEAARAFATQEGAGWLVWLSLSQSPPGLTHAEAVDIAMAMEAPEWQAFDRAAWALDTLDEIDGRINAELGVQLPGGAKSSGNLVKAFVDINGHVQISLADFGNLTLSQWRAIASGGAQQDRSVPIPDGWTVAKFQSDYLRPRKAFFRGNPPDRPEVPGTGAVAT